MELLNLDYENQAERARGRYSVTYAISGGSTSKEVLVVILSGAMVEFSCTRSRMRSLLVALEESKYEM